MVAALETLPPDAAADTLVDVLRRDGAVIVRDLLRVAEVDGLLREVMPYVERTAMGKDDFTGRRTQRTGALVARSPACRAVVTRAAVLEAARRFLAPYTERILLHLTQTIRIHPGEKAQTLHRDRLAWGNHLPRHIEPQFNTIWALTDFTAANGATRVVPGSHAWPDERRADPGEKCQAEMARGSVLCYTGSVLHGGGENRSNAARLGLNITYCLGWLRQEENQFLSCPPQVARTLPEDLQELLGYTMGNYALGYFSEPAPEMGRVSADIRPPEAALGRSPRPGLEFPSV